MFHQVHCPVKSYLVMMKAITENSRSHIMMVIVKDTMFGNLRDCLIFTKIQDVSFLPFCLIVFNLSVNALPGWSL